MRAVVFERNGGPEVLEYKEVPDPSPRAGAVVVDVEAVGVNFRDVYEREGRDYGQKPPAIVGVEGAGKVVGTDERVAWMNVPHSYAERVAANRDNLVPIPDSASFRRICRSRPPDRRRRRDRGCLRRRRPDHVL